MIPRTLLDLDTSIPPKHDGWTPKRDGVSEDGFGFFRDTWLIRDVTIRQAREVMANERSLVELADRVSSDAKEFDAVARALESGDADGLPEELIVRGILVDLEPYLDEALSPLEGLELGVAGLVHALAAVRCWPAASCRGHAAPHAWAAHPVVFVACDTYRARVLEPMIATSGCGLNIDPERPNLLVVEAESVENLMILASLVLETPKAFVRQRERRRSHMEAGGQGTFDF